MERSNVLFLKILSISHTKLVDSATFMAIKQSGDDASLKNNTNISLQAG